MKRIVCTWTLFLLFFSSVESQAAEKRSRAGRRATTPARHSVTLPPVEGLSCQDASAAYVEGCQPTPTRVELRREIQYDAIVQSVYRGQVCWTEAQGLLDEQKAIAVRERRDREDGQFDEREARRLQFMQDYASRNIARTRIDSLYCPPPRDAARRMGATATSQNSVAVPPMPPAPSVAD